jgi:hypothetical protein
MMEIDEAQEAVKGVGGWVKRKEESSVAELLGLRT